MKRIIGLDFGLKRVGVSITDPLGSFAIPLKAIQVHGNVEQIVKIVWNEIQLICKEKRCELDCLVLGLPLTLKGEEKERASEVRKFADELIKLSKLTIQFVDERLTSLQADRSLKEMEYSRKKRTSFSDEVSAALLLQSYLDQRAFQK